MRTPAGRFPRSRAILTVSPPANPPTLPTRTWHTAHAARQLTTPRPPTGARTGGASLLSPLADVDGAISLWTRAGRAIARGVHGDEFTRAFRRVCLAATHHAVEG